jgi:hypothetical protein
MPADDSFSDSAQLGLTRELKNILLISTLDHNPGDDFIRLGQEYLLRQLFPNAKFVVVHKHDPRTLFAGFKQKPTRLHRRLIPFVYSMYTHFPGMRRENMLDQADLVIFAGTPFIWRSDVWPFPSTCANAEWIGATWTRLFEELPEPLVMNIAAGASFSTLSEVGILFRDRKVTRFLKLAASRSALTTARDASTQEILGRLGFEVPLLLCTSIFAAKSAGISPAEPQYVAINVMPGAVHSFLRRKGEFQKWLSTISAVVPEIEKRHEVLFVSHSENEDAAVARWFPGRRRFFSTDPRELLRAYARARFGVCNRVHGAAAIAAFGRPALVIGGDSRIELVAQFGMPAMDHRQTDAADLNAAIAQLEDGYTFLSTQISTRAAEAEREYLRLISSALCVPNPSKQAAG